jgi:hypothetical protein
LQKRFKFASLIDALQKKNLQKPSNSVNTLYSNDPKSWR